MKSLPYWINGPLGEKPFVSIDLYTDSLALIEIAENFDGVQYAERFEKQGMLRLHIKPQYDENEVLDSLRLTLDAATLGDIWRDAIDDLPEDD